MNIKKSLKKAQLTRALIRIIREELYEEFKDHITDTDFDLYFRSAISKYESGMYV